MNRCEKTFVVLLVSLICASFAVEVEAETSLKKKKDIYTINSDGTGLRNITKEKMERDSYFPTWLPDGKGVIFISAAVEGFSSGDIYFARIDTPSPQVKRLTDRGDINWAWVSPDGERVLFISHKEDENGEIYLINSDGSGETRLTRNDLSERVALWSPSGEKVAFIGLDTASGDVSFYVINNDGTNQLQLTYETEGNIANIVLSYWSPDEKWVSFFADWDGNPEIYMVSTDGKGVIKRLTFTEKGREANPRESPDRTKVAFIVERDKNNDLYIMNPDGSERVNLTNHPSEDGAQIPCETHLTHSWSPNSREIAFITDRDGNTEIYIINRDGTNLRRLTYTPDVDEHAPQWSSDGKMILFGSLGRRKGTAGSLRN